MGVRAHVYSGGAFVVNKKVQQKKAVDDVFECCCNVLLCQQIHVTSAANGKLMKNDEFFWVQVVGFA